MKRSSRAPNTLLSEKRIPRPADGAFHLGKLPGVFSTLHWCLHAFIFQNIMHVIYEFTWFYKSGRERSCGKVFRYEKFTQKVLEHIGHEGVSQFVSCLSKKVGDDAYLSSLLRRESKTDMERIFDKQVPTLYLLTSYVL